MRLRPCLLVFSTLAVLAAAACGGKIATVGPGDGGPPASSGSGSSSGVSSGSGSTSGSGSSSGIPLQDCNIDSTIACGSGASGFACPPGTNPEGNDPTLSCSAPVLDASGDDLYCCARDSTVGGASSSGGPPGSGSCTPDSTLACTTGAFGLACTAGYNPETDQRLSCSTPTFYAGEEDYCCFSGGPWSYETCKPDDTLTSVCPDPTSYGYMCVPGDDPVVYDASLNCSVPVPDADGVHDDFCCTYQ